MNIKIIRAALKILPDTLQRKAIAQALNHLFVDKTSLFGDKKTLTLSISDLNKQWLVSLSDSTFSPLEKSASDSSDICLETTYNTILNAQQKSYIIQSLKSGDIAIRANQEDSKRMYSAISAIPQHQIDSLVKGCYTFLRMNPHAHINLKTVTIQDIKKSTDIDYIRDEAIKLESKDLKMALRLMETAHQARPDGPFIKQKVQEYRARLNVSL